MSLLLLGFLIGLRHALEADHIAAVAALATSTRSVGGAIRLGAVWGLGHTLSLFLVGSVVVFMDASMPARFAHLLELGVGLMLVLLGADVLRRIARDRIHFHRHKHEDGREHFHGHAHKRAGVHGEHAHAHPGAFPHRALLVGLVHGMAGSAALILLALNDATSVGQALLYMLLFGLGSMVGMAALSIVIALPLRLSAKGLALTHNAVQGTLGAVTVVIGLMLIDEVATTLL